MHSKVTIVVDRSHWCCVSCQQVNKHTSSVDGHLKSCHSELLCAGPSSSCPSPGLDPDDFAEMECDLCGGDSDERTSKEELSENAHDLSENGPGFVQRKRTADHRRSNAKSTNTPRTRNLSKSVDLPEAGSLQEVPSLQLKKACSPDRLRADWKEHQRRQVDPDISNTDSPVSGMTGETPDQEQGPLRKRRRLRSDSCDQKLHDKHSRIVHSNQSEKRGRRTLKINLRSSSDETDTNNNDSMPRKTRRGHPKCSGKPKDELKCGTHDRPTEEKEMKKSSMKSSVDEIIKDNDADTDSKDSVQKKTRRGRPPKLVKQNDSFRRKLKAVDRESKKYCWGGKPVKRSLKIADEKMKSVKMCYTGSDQPMNFNDCGLNVPLEQRNGETRRKESSAIKLSDSESVSGNNVEMVDQMTRSVKSTQLSPVQGDAVERILDEGSVLDSRAMGNNFESVTSEKAQVSIGGTGIQPLHNKNTDVAEASNSGIYVMNGFSNVTLQVQIQHAQSLHNDVQQSRIDSSMTRDAESFSQTSLASHENVCEARHCTGDDDMSSVDPSVQMLPSMDRPDAFCFDDNFQHSPQANILCGQQYASEAIDAVKNDCSVVEHGKNAESEEWVKNRTIFSFSKPRRTPGFEQPSKIYECEVCQAKFSTSRHLSDHVMTMSTHEASKCQSCHRLFHNSCDLNFHVFEDHERRSEPFCFNCGEKFLNMAAFEKHLHRHKHDHDPELLDMEYHSCHICQTDIPCRYETVRKHYKKHKRAVCIECFVRSELVLLPDSTSVREHQAGHSNFCPVCVQDFSSVEAFNAHCPCQSVFASKEDGHGVLCERCNQWCPNKAIATLHHKEHKLQVMRNWRLEKWAVGIPCAHCDKVLRNKRNLERHIAQLHSNCRSYSFHCEFCGKGVDSKNILKDHIAIHHLGIKRYNCEYCEQRFVCASSLKRHILKEHAPDKQYTCEVCGQRFCEKFKLTRHMYVHTGLARFMCEQCGKGFHSGSEFKKHLAVHQDKRGFACQECGQEYKRKEHLRRHSLKCVRSVHNSTLADQV